MHTSRFRMFQLPALDGAKNLLFFYGINDPELLPAMLVDQMTSLSTPSYRGMARILGSGLITLGYGMVKNDPRKIFYGMMNLAEGLYDALMEVTYRHRERQYSSASDD